MLKSPPALLWPRIDPVPPILAKLLIEIAEENLDPATMLIFFPKFTSPLLTDSELPARTTALTLIVLPHKKLPVVLTLPPKRANDLTLMVDPCDTMFNTEQEPAALTSLPSETALPSL
jgi:hypothetical protein